MAFIQDQSLVSTANSTTTPLAANATFTGTAEDVHAWNSVIVAIKTNQKGLLYVELSIDGTNWDSSVSFNVAANKDEVQRVVITRKYARIIFVNSSTAQAFIRLQTIFSNFDAVEETDLAAVQQVEISANSTVVSLLQKIVDLQKITNNLLTKIYQ
jgi:hypothetical protein